MRYRVDPRKIGSSNPSLRYQPRLANTRLTKPSEMVTKSQRNPSIAASKSAKQPKKQVSKPAAAKSSAPAAVVAAGNNEEENSDDFEDVESDIDSDDDDEDDEYDGVTEEGMKKLMELLGKDGLNEFDMDVLSSVAGGEEDEDEDEDEDDDEELEYGSGDGSQLDDEEDDDEEMDDDEEETDGAAFESVSPTFRSLTIASS